MEFLAPFSRGLIILITILLCHFSEVVAQPTTDDFSAYMGYRGYSAYRELGQGDNRAIANAYTETSRPMAITPNYDSDQMLMMSDALIAREKAEADKPSRIEGFYRQRTGEKDLSQFGYDMLYSQKRIERADEQDLQSFPAGAVQDDYILQAGDEVSIIFQGERKDRESYRIGSDGRLLIDGVSPVLAMGRSLGQLRQAVNDRLNESRYYGSADVTVSAIRQIGVLVAGHVYKPGRHTLNAHHSALDALNLAGGIKKGGTLRNIKLIRGGSTYYIDLYPYFTFGSIGAEQILQDGDRIIVPPLGGTVAVTGDVRQSGIFELKTQNARSQSLKLRQVLAMAGGTMGAGDYSYTLKRGGGDVMSLRPQSGALIGDGAVVDVIRSTDKLADGVELRGYSRGNGIYDLDQAETLKALLDDGRLLGDDTYPLIGVISRVDRGSLTRNLMPFSPQAIVKDKDDRQLESGDIIYLFSNKNIYNLKNKNNEKNNFPKVINKFIRDHMVRVTGAVRQSGEWPVGTVGDLETLIAVAGGLTTKAAIGDIEIISRNNGFEAEQGRRTISADMADWANIMLEPGDMVRINERYEATEGGTVRITGEVRHPGTYDLMRGDTMLSLIERAGGLTAEAYPPAAVFSRQAERKREEQKFRAAAHELEHTVSINMNGDRRGDSLTPAQISMAKQLAEDLREVRAVGRVTVEADPIVLSVRPELNMLLDEGDHLHIPKRSLNVRVSGEVMNPASLLFDDEKGANDYIEQAGGTTYFADRGRSFVVFPDGSAQPLSRGWSLSNRAMIIPGSTIIVPRDPKPFDFVESFKDITQILTNMAITGVFIEDIATDEN